MTKQQTYWTPEGDLDQSRLLALSVPYPRKPDQAMYREMLAEKFQQLVDADPKAAQRALEISPELSQIPLDSLTRHWGTALTMSDQISSQTCRINWARPGSLRHLPTQDILSLMETL